MKLHAQVYTSPLLTEGYFNEVFIEEISFENKRVDNYFRVNFEMYIIKDNKRVILERPFLAFQGMKADKDSTNRVAIINTLNPKYTTQMAEIPYTIQVPNPNYEVEVEGSEEFIIVPNPDYDRLIDLIPLRIDIPLLQYLVESNGVLPEDYKVLEWGYPNYEDVLQYFEGGTFTNPELIISNPFAREWLKNNLMIKGDKIGEQFEFVE